MLEQFLEKTQFESYEDFMANFKVNVPEDFNFGYDVVDRWAETEPDKKALLWTNDKGETIQFTFADIKRESDKTAAFFAAQGIGRGDMVMLILKRHYQFWFSIVALHKLGATVIPATHLLTEKDIIYRCERAGIKAIVATGDEIVLNHIQNSLPKCPSLKSLISTGPIVPEGWLDFNAEIEEAAPFVRPAKANSNDDVSLMYFTSGTTGEPKMVAHDFTYPLGHIITGSFWHNLNEDSLHLTLADTGWAKPCGAGSTDNGLPEQTCLFTTMRNLSRSMCSIRYRNTVSRRSALLLLCSVSSYAKTLRNSISRR